MLAVYKLMEYFNRECNSLILIDLEKNNISYDEFKEVIEKCIAQLDVEHPDEWVYDDLWDSLYELDYEFTLIDDEMVEEIWF